MDQTKFLYNRFSSDDNNSLINKNLNKPYNTTQTLFRIYCYSAFYFLLPFIPFGIILNMLSLVTFSRTGKGTTSSTRVYYIVMAYTELTTVFFKDFWFFWFGVGFPSVFSIDPLSAIHLNPHSKTSLDALCNIMIFLYMTHEMVANNSFVLFALERVISLYYPFFARYKFNKIRALMAIGVLAIIAIPICMITFWLHRKVELSGLVYNDYLCTQDNGDTSTFMVNFPASIMIISVYIFPAVLSATCSILIIIKMISR